MTDLLIKNCLLLDTKDPQEILIKGGVKGHSTKNYDRQNCYHRC